MKIIKGLRHLSCKERLRVFVLLSLEKRKLWGQLIVAFQYLNGAYEKDGLPTEAWGGRQGTMVGLD